MTKRTEKGICGICPANCGVEIGLEHDRIVNIHPWKGHPQGIPCVRGRHAPDIIYSSDRLKTPLKRKGPKGTLKFEAISWEHALDEIAKIIFALKSQYGPECIASFFGRGNFEQSLWQMFSPKEGGYCINSIFMPLGSPNAFSVTSLCFVSYGVFAPTATFGAPMGILRPDLENAEIIFVWGTNPATNSPLNDMIRLQAAKKRGAQVIVIDPLRTAAAKLADQWIPIQPGTDGALIHGILNQCFKKGTIDREFGEKYCEGFALLEEYAERFDPQCVANITRVPQNTLFELADIFTLSKRISLLTHTGLEYSNSGVQSIRALLTLFALTGHLDTQGELRFQFPPSAPLRKPDVKFPTEVPPIGIDRYPFYCRMTKNGQFMEFPRSVLEEEPYKIRFLLIGGASILTSFPNTALFTKALNALEYLVSVDRFFSADALFADMVLPATTYFENVSYCGFPPLTPRPDSIQYRKKIIEPRGEAMNDYLIYSRLAERLGYGHLYPQSEEEMVKYVMRDMPFSFDDFKCRSTEGTIPLEDKSTASLEEKKWRSGRLRRDGKPGFPTPSGKWEITSSALKACNYDPFPGYTEVREGLQNKEINKNFPLTLTSGTRIQSTFRSQHLNIPEILRRQPDAEALIHLEDAKPRNIKSGDKVKVKTVRGEVQFTARVTSDILQGVVEVNQGGGSPIQAEGWRRANVNFLTDDQNRDPISGFPVLKALLCEVEKI
jgi:anaerobic selenocysteine-containing dehydrogenase